MLQTTLRADQAQTLLSFLNQASQGEVIIEVETDSDPQLRLKWGVDSAFYLSLPLERT
jgi:hypothetical protein